MIEKSRYKKSLEAIFSEKGIDFREELQKLKEKGLTRPEVAQILNINVTSVRQYAKKYGIKFKTIKRVWKF